MVDLENELTEPLFEPVQGKAWCAFLMPSITPAVAEEHVVDGSKESFDTVSALRLTKYREHQPVLEVSCHLLQVLEGEIGAIVGVEDVGNTSDLLA
jgi:hypothetical protein